MSRECGAAQNINRRPVDRLKHDWPVVHQTMYSEEGWSWPPDIRQQGGVDFANAVAHLSESDQEKALYYEFIEPGQGIGLGTFDLNPSMNWGSRSPQLLPTITCCARLWVNQVRTLVSGWEALRAQAVPVHRLEFDLLAQRHLMDLVVVQVRFYAFANWL